MYCFSGLCCTICRILLYGITERPQENTRFVSINLHTMNNISAKGKLTTKEHKKNFRDMAVNLVNVLLTSVSAGLYTYLSGDSFAEYTQGLGAFASIAQFAVSSYVLPLLNRHQNLYRV